MKRALVKGALVSSSFSVAPRQLWLSSSSHVFPQIVFVLLVVAKARGIDRPNSKALLQYQYRPKGDPNELYFSILATP